VLVALPLLVQPVMKVGFRHRSGRHAEVEITAEFEAAGKKGLP
jgi:hypothetical protein